MIVVKASQLEMRTGCYEVLPEETKDAPISATFNKAIGTTPLFIVQYTPNGKETPNTYGVFWEGLNKDVRKYGLRKLRMDGKTMFKGGHAFHGKGFFVPVEKCTKV